MPRRAQSWGRSELAVLRRSSDGDCGVRAICGRRRSIPIRMAFLLSARRSAVGMSRSTRTTEDRTRQRRGMPASGRRRRITPSRRRRAEMRVKRWSVAVLGLVALWLASQPRPKADYRTWSDYGGSVDGMQYSALKQIDKKNVGKLQVAWYHAVPGTSQRFGFNPLIVDGVMYLLGADNAIAALNAATGKRVWTHPSEVRKLERATRTHVAAVNGASSYVPRPCAVGRCPRTHAQRAEGYRTTHLESTHSPRVVDLDWLYLPSLRQRFGSSSSAVRRDLHVGSLPRPRKQPLVPGKSACYPDLDGCVRGGNAP